MDDNNFGVPAGWYPDPLGLPQLRWWDSQSWTDHTSEARAPIVIQSAATNLAYADDEDELPSRREQREREKRQDFSTDFFERSTQETQRTPAQEPLRTEPDSAKDELSAQPLLATTLRELEPPPADLLDDQTPDPKRAAAHTNASPVTPTLSALTDEAAPERELKQMGTYTVPVWIMAGLPLLQLLVSAIIILMGAGHNFALLLVVWLAPYVLLLGLAAYDALVLQTWGHRRPASPLWALLAQPGYLGVRATRTWRETGKGFAPLIAWGGSVVGVLVGVLILPGLLLSVFPQTFSEEVEQAVASAGTVFGTNLIVECPAPPLMVGETIMCRATRGSGSADSISVFVSLQRANGWISWKVEDWGSWVRS